MAIETISKVLVRRLFSASTLPRIPFIPWVYSHCARLEQVSVRTMVTDPEQLSKALKNAQKLYGYDAVVCPFDPSLEAEACGCALAWQSDNELPRVVSGLPAVVQADTYPSYVSELSRMGRLGIVLEAMRRLRIVLAQKVALVAVVTGPVSLAQLLLGRDITQELIERPDNAKMVLSMSSQVALKVCKLYCELQPDVVAVADDLVLCLPPKHLGMVASLFQPIGNIARFYNVWPVLVTKVQSNTGLEVVANLNMDGAVIGGMASPAEIRQLINKGLVIGIGLPSSMLTGSKKELNSLIAYYMEVSRRQKFFLSTECEFPYETSPEVIHDLVKTVATFSAVQDN